MELLNCTECGKEIPNSAAFCPDCGASGVVRELPEKQTSVISAPTKSKFRGLQRLFAAYLMPFFIIYTLTEERILPENFIVKVTICLIALMPYCWYATYKMKKIYEKPTTALIQLTIAFIFMQFAYYAERNDAKLFITKNGLTSFIFAKLNLINIQQTISVIMIVVLLICYAREWYRIDSTPPPASSK